jgi:hypothetical protein
MAQILGRPISLPDLAGELAALTHPPLTLSHPLAHPLAHPLSSHDSPKSYPWLTRTGLFQRVSRTQGSDWPVQLGAAYQRRMPSSSLLSQH